MRYVYRIENGLGIGPYLTDTGGLFDQSYKFSQDYTDVDNPRFPPPLTDPGIDRYPNENEYCAFESLKQLLEWFQWSDVLILLSFGYKLRKFKAHVTAIGSKQILIKKT